VTTIPCNSPDAARRHCRTVTRRRARNFYWGLRLLPEPQRTASYVIYAWMRRADDIVDDAADPSEARGQLDAFRAATDGALHGRVSADDLLFVALADLAARHRLPADQFHAVLDGQRDDLEGRTYETIEDTLAYCRRVASSVGLICIEIWGYHDERGPALAVDRGIAFQLTNILRDLTPDARTGRCYLPAADLKRHNLSASKLLAWADPPRCGAFIQEQVARAESYYRHSAPLDSMVATACRPTLWAMTRIYHDLLAAIGRRPRLVAGGRPVRLSGPRKVLIMLQARWWPRHRAEVNP
jgi:phytoene synthase